MQIQKLLDKLLAAHLKEEMKKKKKQMDIEDADIVIPSPMIAPAVETLNFEPKKVKKPRSTRKLFELSHLLFSFSWTLYSKYSKPTTKTMQIHGSLPSSWQGSMAQMSELQSPQKSCRNKTGPTGWGGVAWTEVVGQLKRTGPLTWHGSNT